MDLRTAGGQDVQSRGAPKTREEVLNSEWHRDLSTPKVGVGDQAVDFFLPTLPSDTASGPESVRLSDYAGRMPVALIFGSYT